MKLDLENIFQIIIYMAVLLTVVGCLVSLYRIRISHKIEYILKIISLNRIKYSKMRLPKEYFSYLKYDIWRYSTLF